MGNNTQTENISQRTCHKEEFPLGNNSNLFQHCSQSDILGFQLNCHNRYDTTISVLNSKLTHSALLFQEPWINPHTWKPPLHQNWHRITPSANPRNKDERPSTCTYINKQIAAPQF
ncbi:hypothetical protein O181_069009 [Austropuccinia psidii MF-1]|uniref:Uncharacterized protein n=1 Tax=Austropuccinia psidii MF-1 TaxID=1389203 RepID=A0A9Q3EYF1_9BASI|nr:hypothetical protein [Austropuccinia psidii MF-1]